ncbi:hypothetical protein D2V17_13035 [Aurantiacibacter xanthus]|uniref:Asparagine synthetase domain-containing protein n=1 Tax=Aurantiacibacter xanthus TaxID=1784712 RepID=A0A3A1P2P1_9SPHN|nr:hypothetical protein [Aurantiacibacter xanthus]RIV83511.1 hypothetical protein D2V17_13035 [Aurantiacibacter xanthus]
MDTPSNQGGADEQQAHNAASSAVLDAFIRGYAVLPGQHEFTLPWQRLTLGRHFCVHAHPKTEILAVTSGPATLCLVGRAYDLDTGVTTAACARTALNEFQHGGIEAALKYIAYLGGRFAVFIAENDILHAIPDCHATYAIYSFPLNGARAFCSHWMLASEIAGLAPSAEIAEFMNHPDYVETGGKYYPALWTPFANVTCVFPNCHATFDAAAQNFSHQRFYPFEELPTRSVASAYPEFADLLTRSVNLAATGRVALSLTNGGDSRTVLAALSRPYADDAFSFTYGRLEALDEGSRDDLLGGNAVAFQARIPHRIFDLLKVDYSCDFHKLYSRSFKNGARFPSLARLYFDELPHDCTIIISTVGETGTVFYKKRDKLTPSPLSLAEKFTNSSAKNHSFILDQFESYIDYLEFFPENIYNFDWHDLFYWEHRNAKWAAAWYAEVDMTGFPIAPYNCRRLIEVMLSVSKEEREARTLQRMFVQEKGLAG